ncbi:hypothetical protein [Halostella litorea]|uniref:hypothetical protein n=1 Tax=Halostella litorea TaxID=2528831 RepID=UPI00109269C0|nr:hypothetical protein [Halostella litorea]
MRWDRQRVPSVPLDTALLGVSPRRTLVGVAYLVCLSAFVAMSAAAARATVGGVRLLTLTPAFDTLYWALIVVVVLSTFVVPLAYALFNGGPALAFLTAVAPEAVVYAMTGRLYLTPDLVLGLVFGALAAAVALYVTAYREYGSLSPGSHGALDGALFCATATTVVAAVALARLYATGTAAIAARTEPFGAAVGLAVALVALCWVDAARAAED